MFLPAAPQKHSKTVKIGFFEGIYLRAIFWFFMQNFGFSSVFPLPVGERFLDFCVNGERFLEFLINGERYLELLDKKDRF